MAKNTYRPGDPEPVIHGHSGDTDQLDLVAHARRTDPETSHEAAASITSDTLRQSQFDVLGLFRRFGPMTDKGLIACAKAHVSEQSDSGLRTRRAELVDKGKLRFTGRYEKIGRRRHRIWETT